MPQTSIAADLPAARLEAVAPSCPCPGHEGVPRRPLDVESQAWWDRLHASDPVRSRAIAELHQRLRREAAFHVRHHVRALPHFPRSDIDDLATQAANDALMVLLRKLEDYRGESQFWTWARRFAQLEAPGSVRRRLGHDQVGISPDPEQALLVADPGCSPQDLVETRHLLQTVNSIMDHLSARQRTILVAIAINGSPTETLARELDSTPGAIYKSLHDARAKLKFHLAAAAC